MKLSEINKNVLVIVSSILTDTVNYLRDTTEIAKAASGRATQVTLEKRADVLEKLVLEARAGKDRELTKVEEEIVKDVYRDWLLRPSVPSDRPVPHYTRVNSTRKANVVLVLKAGKIDGVSFTGF